MAAPIYIPTTNSAPGFPVLHTFVNTCSLLFDSSHSHRCEENSCCGLICISLMTADVEHFVMYQLAVCMSYSGKCLFKSFARFLIELLLGGFLLLFYF